MVVLVDSTPLSSLTTQLKNLVDNRLLPGTQFSQVPSVTNIYFKITLCREKEVRTHRLLTEPQLLNDASDGPNVSTFTNVRPGKVFFKRLATNLPHLSLLENPFHFFARFAKDRPLPSSVSLDVHSSGISSYATHGTSFRSSGQPSLSSFNTPNTRRRLLLLPATPKDSVSPTTQL